MGAPLFMVSKDSESSHASNRRVFFTQSVAAVAAWNALLLPVPSAVAAVSGVGKVNTKLKSFGLPPVTAVPDGFAPLLEIYGKGKNRTPLLVTFSHPLSWVVTLPSNNVNGEDGTIQAGDYGKGDTATLYVYNPENGAGSGDITTQPKELFEAALKRCISQRGDNMYQNFKLTKLVPGSTLGGAAAASGYMYADFKYQLLTGAGFEVDRKGVAAITSEGGGKSVQVLWAASTDARYKKTEPTLRNIVQSFRCYADGLNFSEDLVTFEEQI